MAVHRTTFPIAATAEAVWAILVDFQRWPEEPIGSLDSR
jgi:hypothetical protein